MIFSNFAEEIVDGIEFIIAFGSILGLLGLIVGIIGVVWGGLQIRRSMFSVVVISIILLAVCGVNTGLVYFRVFR